ncbi:MAG: extracellular solute-binding protein [Actinomycetota bacterium]
MTLAEPGSGGVRRGGKGIKVVVQVATDVRPQFKDATKVGKGPDVIVGAHDWLGELVQNNTVSPVNLSAADAAKFAPQAIAATKFNGQSYGVPYAVENIALVGQGPVHQRRHH